MESEKKPSTRVSHTTRESLLKDENSVKGNSNGPTVHITKATLLMGFSTAKALTSLRKKKIRLTLDSLLTERYQGSVTCNGAMDLRITENL